MSTENCNQLICDWMIKLTYLHEKAGEDCRILVKHEYLPLQQIKFQWVASYV